MAISFQDVFTWLAILGIIAGGFAFSWYVFQDNNTAMWGFNMALVAVFAFLAFAALRRKQRQELINFRDRIEKAKVKAGSGYTMPEGDLDE